MEMVALSKVALVCAVALLGCAYQATRPPPPAILGAPGGPPVTSPRVRLRDGRYLAYREEGAPREKARFRVVFFHGFSSSKESGFPVSSELVEELGIYMLFLDRAGYGDSDANPKGSLKSDATDVEELADALRLGDRFYVVGVSMGAYPAWGCLNYIPHRLAGAALVVPAVNYWWPLPADVSRSAYGKLDARDRRAFWVTHHAPSLFYAWITQRWFRACRSSGESATPSPTRTGRSSPSSAGRSARAAARWLPYESSSKATQQGIHESLCRDVTILFGTWEFDPTEIKNPFPDGEGVVSIWQGYEDRIVQVEIQRHVAQKLPWVR
ncbi:hypothetical protein U9M48_017076 [Paspalum notatum var. saurae]|uniref:AB hydrolase-1 domain-containing protein n=1 Tax=Paspalum notatum var. saurae TaxID=547442 RepID=A0AAQ3T7V1_PASNO